MGMLSLDVRDLLAWGREEVVGVVGVIQEKGLFYYQKPLLFSGLAILAIHLFLYKPTVAKLEDLHRRIGDEKVKASYAEKHKSLQMQMLDHYSRMPKPSEREGWLFRQVLQSANKQNIILDSIGAQVEVGKKDYWVLSVPITVKLKFAQLGQWIQGLEDHKPAMFVTSLIVRKVEPAGKTAKEVSFGVHRVSMEITTLVPKELKVF